MPPKRQRNPKATAAINVESENTRTTVGDVELLLALAADGDERAWSALICEFGGLVWAATRAHRLSPADAADVSQITWLRLIENLGLVTDPARLGSWLATTARRECINVMRRSARVILCGDDIPDRPTDAPDPSERLISAQSAQEIQSALGRLAERDRTLLGLLAQDPAPSYVQVSAMLGMPVGSIGPTRARALARLRSETPFRA
jgi:RNA polymerase sigma factor (sigma-70 family)